MSALTDEVCALIDRANEDERRAIFSYLRQRVHLHPLEKEWGTTAESILSAIERSADITRRGVRGILAEAIFEEFLIPKTVSSGWAAVKVPREEAYDFCLARESEQVKIQVKLQRREEGEPKEFGRKARAALNCPEGTVYVVEVQKTRGGKKNGEATRPYRFGDFDILAVNLHPATGDWKRFMFTVGSWLLPRDVETNQIEIMQPVPPASDDYWTDDLTTCIEWFLAGTTRRLYA